MSRWWSWVPGLQKKALETCRREALSSITGERLFVERMAQRRHTETETPPAETFRDEVLAKINEIYTAAETSNNIDELDDLTDDAELQRTFRRLSLSGCGNQRSKETLSLNKLLVGAFQTPRPKKCASFGKKLLKS